MSLFSRTTLALGLGVLIGTGVSLTHGVLAEKPGASGEAVPFQELQSFVEILNRVKSEYVEPVEDKTLFENAVRGMIAGLDPHSSYLNREEFKDINIATSGKFGGLGIEVQMQNGFVRVVSPIDDTPAARAGVQPGDLIIRIDDTPVKGLSLDEAVKMMRGEPGTRIKLVIARENAPAPITLELKRDVIAVTSVRGRLLGDGLGYLRISSFTTETGSSLNKELSKLVKSSDQPLKGLVLDLRNNPGGVLDAAVQVSDAFLDTGAIVSIRGRDAAESREFRAQQGDLLQGAPVVVMINGGSASASEIVAGALQDQKRAVLVGSKSFGKGSVQSIMPLSNQSAIKLTTARYYTPSGRSIQGEGIEPDIVIRPLRLAAEQDAPAFEPTKEADLKGSLKNENGQTPAPKTGAATDEEVQKLAEQDYALYEALNLLKGLVVTRTRL
ncbi:MAG: S41 family peptidase [Gammaproteobacteria bacterium]|jgi:carboxyl-terminal processing protease